MSNKFALLLRHFLFLSLALWSAVALAHIDLIAASPGKDEVILKPIQVITLTLTGKVEPKFSKIEVTEIATKKRFDLDEAVVNQEKKTLSVFLKAPLNTGKYHVNWKAISADTHKAHGEYDFTYAPKN